MSANQWWGIRNRLKKSVPGTVTLDWIMGALDTTQKGAGNVLPQLRLLGLIDANNKPTDLIHDFRDDASYAEATKQILGSSYPSQLLESYDDPEADPSRVASWFGRNAKTGERASQNQAKLYLLILSGKLPDPDGVIAKPKPAVRPAKKPNSTKAAPAEAAPALGLATPAAVHAGGGTRVNAVEAATPAYAVGPSIHIDLQVHVSADAGDAQIESIFKSMAKHLYGK